MTLTFMQTTAAAVLAFAPGVAAQLTFTGLSLVLVVVFWHCQPFYRHGVNAYHVAVFVLAVYTGGLSVLAVGSQPNTVLANVLAYGAVLVLPVGLYVASWRFMTAYTVWEPTFPDMGFSPFDNRLETIKVCAWKGGGGSLQKGGKREASS